MCALKSTVIKHGQAGLSASAALVLVIICLSLLSSISMVKADEASQVSEKNARLTSSSVITIGVAADLSGGNSTIGWGEANSVQLAISQTNAAGGINIGGITYTVALVTADSPCGNSTQAITVANTLLAAGAKAVVGHTCSGISLAAQPVYNAAGVPMISPSSSNVQVTQHGYTTTFRTVNNDGAPVALMATYFRGWVHLSRSAIIENFNVATDVYSNTFTARGGIITSRHIVTSTADFTNVLMAIQAENPDVIANFYATSLGQEAGQFSRIAYNLGMTNVVIGWSTWGSAESDLPPYSNAAGSLAANGDIAGMEFRRTQDMPGWPAFLAAYQAAGFVHVPTGPATFGAYAYDAAQIIIAAMARANSTDPLAIRDQIAATKNYAGVVGTYLGFDLYGDVIPQWSWLEQYQNGQWVILNPSKAYLPIILK